MNMMTNTFSIRRLTDKRYACERGHRQPEEWHDRWPRSAASTHSQVPANVSAAELPKVMIEMLVRERAPVLAGKRPEFGADRPTARRICLSEALDELAESLAL